MKKKVLLIIAIIIILLCIIIAGGLIYIKQRDNKISLIQENLIIEYGEIYNPKLLFLLFPHT